MIIFDLILLIFFLGFWLTIAGLALLFLASIGTSDTSWAFFTKIAYITAFCLFVLIAVCFIDSSRRDWDNEETDWEVWKSVFCRSLFFGGLMGPIVYYSKMLRNNFLSTFFKKLFRYRCVQYYMNFYSSIGNLDWILFMLLGGIAWISFIFFNSDLIFFIMIKAAAISFFVGVAGFFFELFVMNDIVTRKWTDDSYEYYLKLRSAKYYKDFMKDRIGK